MAEEAHVSNPVPSDLVNEPAEASPSGTRLWFAVLALVCVWGFSIYRLGTLWQANPEYSYGWLVPGLCLCLAWERWKARPVVSSAPARVGPLIAATCLHGVLLAAFLFLEVVPNWRLAAWVVGLCLVGITGCVLYLLGGRKWLNHFSFPLFFFLVAIPWPNRIEGPLVEAMSTANAVFSTFVSNLLGMPAIRQGVVIQTGAGTVGVEDACSGIRSLQASITVALFLGELFRYTFVRRVFFLFAGASLAFICNVVRTTYLVRLCDTKGPEAAAAGHDSAGFLIMGITFAGLLLLAWLLHFRAVGGRDDNEEGDSVRAEDEGSAAATSGLRRSIALLLVSAVVVVGILAFEVGCHIWFGRTEAQALRAKAWIPSFPTNQAEFREIEIAKTSADVLKYDEGKQVEWTDRAGRVWKMFYLRWLPAASLYRAADSAVQARTHAASVCLRNVGMVLQKGDRPRISESGGVKFYGTFERYSDRGTVVHVWAYYWEPNETGLEAGLQAGTGTADALKRVLAGLRQHDRGRGEKRIVKVAVSGMSSDEEAQKEFATFIQGFVRQQ